MSACKGLQGVLCLLLRDEFNKRETSVTSKLHRQPEAFELKLYSSMLLIRFKEEQIIHIKQLALSSVNQRELEVTTPLC
jgi:hypothetical protein